MFVPPPEKRAMLLISGKYFIISPANTGEDLDHVVDTTL
jgi:hypothetical protein